jgi:hypothetical protein
MSKSKISQYFNPDQHLVLHQDKEGNMVGGGYQVNNLLYQHKMPLFVSLDDDAAVAGRQTGGGGGSGGGGGGGHEHFIPDKFSDLFKDLAVPAGLFMMPSLFKPRNYAFEVPEADTVKPHKDTDTDTHDDDDTDTDDDDDAADGSHKTKMIPTDIFDTLLSLVTPTERIQHDVKTRRHRGGSGTKDKKRRNKTKRTRM